MAILIGLFSGLSLVLAAIAVYGVIAWSVTERTHEIGVRMAVGAEPGHVLRMVIVRGMAVALAGTVAGAALSYALARTLAGLVYGVSATDTATFATAPLLLMGVALAAAYLPARRATLVDPVRALRSE